MLIAPEAQNMCRSLYFLEEPLEKNSDSEVVRLPPHVDFIREIF